MEKATSEKQMPQANYPRVDSMKTNKILENFPIKNL